VSTAVNGAHTTNTLTKRRSEGPEDSDTAAVCCERYRLRALTFWPCLELNLSPTTGLRLNRSLILAFVGLPDDACVPNSRTSSMYAGSSSLWFEIFGFPDTCVDSTLRGITTARTRHRYTAGRRAATVTSTRAHPRSYVDTLTHTAQ
jgi:hypothetical protein